MASPTQWTWVCISSRNWWWTGSPGLLQSMGLQRVGHGWATEKQQSHHLQTVTVLLPFFLICISFFFTLPWLEFPKLYWIKVVRVEMLWLTLDLKGNVFSFSPLNIGLSCMAFIIDMLMHVPSMPTFWRVLNMNGCWILSKYFSLSFKMIIWFIYFFQFVNVVCHWLFCEYWRILASLNKSNFIMVYDLLNVGLTVFCWGIFASMFLSDALCLVAQSCPTLFNPMDCSPQASSVQGDFPGKNLKWVAITSSRGCSQPKDWTQVSHIQADSLPFVLPGGL